MFDFSKCGNESCPSKHKCYRYTTKGEVFQWYIKPEGLKDGKCEHFIDNYVQKCRNIAEFDQIFPKL